jgi:adenine-specific DNA-methyltransferase
LVWEGKYDANGRRVAPLRVALPFQTVETVNESAQDRQRGFSFGPGFREQEWRNRLIWGDKKYVLPSLLAEFAGKINLIYIDSPFDTGADFSFTARVPENPDTDDDAFTFTKAPSIIEHKAYRDTWGRGIESYLQWFYESAALLHELLSENGSIYVHLDWHVAHYGKLILDEIFGEESFRNEIVWKRKGGSANPLNRLGTVTDSIFWYSKSAGVVFNPQLDLKSDNAKKYIEERFTYTDESGRRFRRSPLVSPNPRPNLTYDYKGYNPPKNGWAISIEKMREWDAAGKLYFPADKTQRIERKIFLDEYQGQPIQNLWTDVFVVNPVAEERVSYDTQKPETLLERVVKMGSNEGELV